MCERQPVLSVCLSVCLVAPTRDGGLDLFVSSHQISIILGSFLIIVLFVIILKFKKPLYLTVLLLPHLSLCPYICCTSLMTLVFYILSC